MNKKIIFVLGMLVSIVLACSLTNVPTGGATPDVESEPVVNSEPVETTVSPNPVSIRVGLASLNTYSLAIIATYTGPNSADYSQMRYEIKNSEDLDASSTHTTNSSSSVDSPELDQTDSYTYTIGNASCSGSDEDGWDYTTTDPQSAEMQELLGNMVDIIPIIENPTFVGSEPINGIQTNHFSFQVSGLGLKSGAQVTLNQGDYWLAQDGQYIVRYSLVTETANTTDMTTLHMEFLIDLSDVNTPVEITFPTGCVPTTESTNP
jgi:hypothetical protein